MKGEGRPTVKFRARQRPDVRTYGHRVHPFGYEIVVRFERKHPGAVPSIYALQGRFDLHDRRRTQDIPERSQRHHGFGEDDVDRGLPDRRGEHSRGTEIGDDEGFRGFPGQGRRRTLFSGGQGRRFRNRRRPRARRRAIVPDRTVREAGMDLRREPCRGTARFRRRSRPDRAGGDAGKTQGYAGERKRRRPRTGAARHRAPDASGFRGVIGSVRHDASLPGSIGDPPAGPSRNGRSHIFSIPCTGLPARPAGRRERISPGRSRTDRNGVRRSPPRRRADRPGSPRFRRGRGIRLPASPPRFAPLPRRRYAPGRRSPRAP